MVYPRLENGDKVILLYILFTYCIPMFMNVLYFEDIESIYKREPLNVEQVIYLLLVIIIYLFIRPIVFQFKFSFRTLVRKFFVKSISALYKISTIIAFAMVLVAVYWVLSGYSNYRYADAGISSNMDIFFMSVLIFGIFSKIYFFWKIFIYNCSLVNNIRKRQPRDILVAIFLLITISGVMSALFALTALIYSLFPQKFTGLIFEYGIVRNKNLNLKRHLVYVFGVVIAVLVFLSAWIMGQALKTHSMSLAVITGAFDYRDFFHQYFLYLVERTSSSYYAYAYSLTPEFSSNFYEQYLAVGIVSNAFLYRLDVVLGGVLEVSRPVVGNLMRLNYLMLAELPSSESEGTSAGLLASFSYVFPRPFNLICTSVYLAFIANFINQIDFGVLYRRLNIIGAILLTYFLIVFFESPFDIFVLFDDAPVYLCLLIIVCIPGIGNNRRLANEKFQQSIMNLEKN